MSKLTRFAFCMAFPLFWPLASLNAQSQSSSQQSPPSQQPQPQASSPAQTKDAPAADAAKKTGKAKPKPKKIYTEDDLSGMGRGSVSVVGKESRKKPRRTQTDDQDGDYAPNSEEYWRGRSQPILDEIAATEQQIGQLKEDIKKYGNGGFDVQTGRQDNIAYIHDRNAQVEALQKRKAALQKELEDLEDEGRKAGAQPAWFR